MNLRNAILQAADTIEQNPSLFEFTSVQRPDPECGTPACALGWIAAYAPELRGDLAENGRSGWDPFIAARAILNGRNMRR